MKKLTVYNVYMEDREDVFKVTVPAESKKAALDYVNGNGEIVTIKESELQDIDIDFLRTTLQRSGWRAEEVAVITRTLEFAGLSRQ